MKKSAIGSAICSVLLGILAILFLEVYRGAMPLAYGQEMIFTFYLVMLLGIIGLMILAIAGAAMAGKE